MGPARLWFPFKIIKIRFKLIKNIYFQNFNFKMCPTIPPIKTNKIGPKKSEFMFFKVYYAISYYFCPHKTSKLQIQRKIEKIKLGPAILLIFKLWNRELVTLCPGNHGWKCHRKWEGLLGLYCAGKARILALSGGWNMGRDGITV